MIAHDVGRSPRRCRCSVPFCTRTRGPRKGDRVEINDTFEWICGPHWSSVPSHLRRRRGRITRMMNRASGERLVRLHAIDGIIWRRCKMAAIERAAGL